MGKTTKLLPRFTGPYQVVRRVCPNTYLVEDLPARRRRRRWRRLNAHVSQIRVFRTRVVEDCVDELEDVTELNASPIEDATLEEPAQLTVPASTVPPGNGPQTPTDVALAGLPCGRPRRVTRRPARYL